MISVKHKASIAQLYRSVIEEKGVEPPEWISTDPTTMSIAIHRLPGAEDISLPVDVGMVIELLSR